MKGESYAEKKETQKREEREIKKKIRSVRNKTVAKSKRRGKKNK